MTDKEMIINGVDVSECEHINTCDNKIKCVILQDDVCETNPYCEGYNCYYKQLKAKYNEFVSRYKAKEQECEKLKEAIDSLLKIQYQLADSCTKYEQTLAEIIRFFKEDEKFARYSGRPIIFAKPTLEEIEKILKENDIKIS